MALIGFGVAIFYWFIEALVYALLPNDIGFFQRLIGPHFNDLLTRFLALVLLRYFWIPRPVHHQPAKNRRSRHA